jgi:hypothetical protein
VSSERLEETFTSNPAIAWLSYTVHGNEASTLETAIQTAYTLAAATNPEVEAWLEEVVVVIDPLLNPDGHHRYITWFENTRGAKPIPHPDAAEHWEPWPGGRSNHYLFDLNRDWLWLVHPESRSRLAAYRRYMPHLHIDYHEQSYFHPYFLGEGATPYNVNIPQATRDWIELYGEENSKVFDAHGLEYSSRERFDYLYPGYGKVTPVYHGAIGMLAEQAGHSRAGLAIEVDEHYILTLAERAHNHFLLSMSNIETTAKHRRGQLERFRAFFMDACNPDVYDVKAYVIHGDNDPAKLEFLWDLCASHGIEVHAVDQDVTLDGLWCYRDGSEHDDVVIPARSWLIRADQPLGALAATLLERETAIEDPDTYDITSWSAIIAFGLNAYESRDSLNDVAHTLLTSWARPAARITGNGEVALIVDARQHEFPKAIGLAIEHGIRTRVAGEDFRIDDRDFAMGSLIVHFIRNDQEQLHAFMHDLLDHNLSGHLTARGLTQEGPVLGANVNRRLTLPKVAVLRGSPISSLSYGQIWHLLDVVSPIDYTPLNVDRIGRVDLDRYNVLIVPHVGNLSSTLGSSNVDRIRDWVRSGGTLIGIGGGATWANRTILELRESAIDEDAELDLLDDEEDMPPAYELTWEQRQARSVENRVSGATLRVLVDRSHPIAAGLPDWMGLIKRGARTIPVSDNGQIIARFDALPHIAGSITDRNAAVIGNTPFVVRHSLGSGKVIAFSDDPTLRGFTHQPARLLLNAIIYGPTY